MALQMQLELETGFTVNYAKVNSLKIKDSKLSFSLDWYKDAQAKKEGQKAAHREVFGLDDLKTKNIAEIDNLKAAIYAFLKQDERFQNAIDI